MSCGVQLMVVVLDRDPQTKKKYYFTAPPSSKKLLIPEYYKEVFKSKQITCGMLSTRSHLRPG